MQNSEYFEFKPLINRGFYFFSLLAFTQFFFLTVITAPKFEYILTFLAVYLTSGFFLYFLSIRLLRWRIYYFNNNYYLFLLMLTFLSTLLTSRFSYIEGVLENGLAATRSDKSIGSGSFFTAINLLFYPLACLLIFHKKNLKRKIGLLLTIISMIIDTAFIGTRNIPFFIAIIFLLSAQNNIKNRLVLSLVVAFISFNLTTFFRSGTDLANFQTYWLWKSTKSGIYDSFSVNTSLIYYLNENTPFLIPLFYLIGYISHSIGDFFVYLNKSSDFLVPHFVHLADQIALYTFSDRTEFSAQIEALRIRGGYYQTFFTSAIIDLGFLLPYLLLIIIFISRFRFFLGFLFMLYFWTILAPIENYFFQGLKPIRFFAFYLFFHFFLFRNIKRVSNPYKVHKKVVPS